MLGDVVDYGKTHKAEPSTIPDQAWVLELEDIEKDSSRLLERLSFAERKSKSTKNVFNTGDVLYGKLRPYLNKILIADRQGFCSTEIIPLPPGEALEAGYLFYWLKSPEFLAYTSEVSHGINMPRLGTEAGRNAPFVLAPLNEQHRIAAKLDNTIAAVEACRQRLDGVAAILKRFRQAVLVAATSGELTREWREERGESVEPWKTVKTKEAGKIQLGRQRSPKYHSGPTMRPYLRVQNVFEDRIDLDDVMEMDFSGADLEKYTLHPCDILLNEGQSPQYLGRPAMYRGELTGACFTNSLIRFQAGTSVVPDFALLVFRHCMHSGRYVSEGTITTNIAHLSAGRFGEVEFPLPSQDEQTEIVRRAQELFTLADQIGAKLTPARKSVDRLTPALLAKAFHGELVPQDPSDEPAKVLLERIRAAGQVEAAAGRPFRRGRGKLESN
jgi:type I restriction enzyme S subunit